MVLWFYISFRSHSPLLVSLAGLHPTPSKELCYVVWFLRHRNWNCCLLLTHHHESSITDIYLANISLGFTQHLQTTYLPCYILHSMTPLLFSIYYLFISCHHLKKSLFSGLAWDSPSIQPPFCLKCSLTLDPYYYVHRFSVKYLSAGGSLGPWMLSLLQKGEHKMKIKTKPKLIMSKIMSFKFCFYF